jgi:hypothetical protein
MIGGKGTFGLGTHATPETPADLTEKTLSVSMEFNGERVDSTTWGTTGFRTFESSFKEIPIVVRFKQDAAILQTIYDLWKYGDETAFTMEPDDPAESGPVFSGELIVMSYRQGLNVGELVVLEANCQATGEVALA